MLQSSPLPFTDRVKAAASVLTSGRLPNPLASAPEDRSRGALVKQLNDWCVEERAFWKPVFERIRQEQKFASGKQWESQKFTTDGQEDYIGDMVQQMVNRKTASLSAKNPKPEAVVIDRLIFTDWDERQETIENCKRIIAEAAQMAIPAAEAAQAGQPVAPPPPALVQDLEKAKAILTDYQRGMAEKNRLKKVAKTGEKLIEHQWRSQSPDLLVMAKRAVTQIITSRVAYVKVMFKRDMEVLPAETANEMELDEKLAGLQARLEALQRNEIEPDDARRAEIALMQKAMQQEMQELQTGQEVPGKEQVVFDWLSATSVIVDRRCKDLKEFVGAHRIAHEMMMTVEEVESKYKVSLRDTGARTYSMTADGWQTQDRQDYQNDDRRAKERFGKEKVCVWEIQDKDTGMKYVVCDGVKNFLHEPEENYPDVNRFWTITAVTFNVNTIEENFPEDDCTIYPRSDVRLMMPMQINVNTSGQDKRKHRAANRPAWVGVKAKFSSTGGVNDLEKLAAPRNGHDVLMLENLADGDDISRYIQPLPKQEMDPALYDNSADQQAMMLATGQQPSDMGTQRPDEKATGQNIAAAARAASESSNIDDLDFWFSTLAQMVWEICVTEMRAETVVELVGRGAVWTEINREDIAKSVFMKIQAGSMGRPNQQQDIAKLQVLGPQILQMLQLMGKSPEPLLRMALRVYDANIDLDQLLEDSAVQPPPAPPAEQQKPPAVSISLNVKDLPPTEQNQAVQKFYGLAPASPQETLLNKIGMREAVTAHTSNNAPPEPAGTNGPVSRQAKAK